MREVSATNSRGSGFGLCAKKNMSQKYACVFNAKQSEKYCFCALKQQLGNIWIFTCGEYLDIHMPDGGPVEKKYWAFTFSNVESADLKFNMQPLDDNSKRTYDTKVWRCLPRHFYWRHTLYLGRQRCSVERP